MQFKCRKCGQLHALTVEMLKSSTWRAQSTAARWTGTGHHDLARQPDSDRITELAGPPPLYRETPVRAPTPTSEVVVPALMSGAAAVLAMADTAVLMLNVHFRQWPLRAIESLWPGPPTLTLALETVNPFLIFLTVPCVVATLAWAHYTGVLRATLWRVEEWTQRDVDGNKQIGAPKPKTNFRLIRASGVGITRKNIPVYEPEQNEEYLNIPGLPRQDTDPWTVKRLVNFLESAFVTGRWSRAHCNEHGASQGQWKAIEQHIISLGEQDETGKTVSSAWGTRDRPTLQALVDQISGDVSQSTANQPTNQE